MDTNEIADRLGYLCQDLLFPSESDYPLEPFILLDASPNPEAILAGLGKSTGNPIEIVTLGNFFAPVINEYDSGNEEDRAIAQGFRDLQAAIASLENVQVFKVGKIRIDMYIVGAIGNDVVGIKTTVIET
jgi:Nuclease A inhibitor-like protein